MKFPVLLILSSCQFLLCSCTMFYTKQPASAPVASTPKPQVVPVGKNWQVIEEAPMLSDGSRLPFQNEQSLHPEAARPASPPDNRTIQTSH